jgi:hypothetical protein
MLISAIIYYYAGPLVTSPALGSASPLVSKIAFGIALPTIIVAGVVNGSVACKYIYLRMWAGTDVVHQNNWKSLGSWWTICALAWFLSWVLAEAIPNFNLLLGLIAALFGSWFSCGLPSTFRPELVKGEFWLTKGRCNPAMPLVLSASRKPCPEQTEDRSCSVQRPSRDYGSRYCKYRCCFVQRQSLIHMAVWLRHVLVWLGATSWVWWKSLFVR